jgi:hypothetical protein
VATREQNLAGSVFGLLGEDRREVNRSALEIPVKVFLKASLILITQLQFAR